MEHSLYIKSLEVQPYAGEEEPYYMQLPAVKALRQMGRLRLQAPVTFLVGENGGGKSTLLEAVAVASGFNAEGGTRNFNFSTFASHSGLHEYMQLVRGAVRASDGFFLRAESYYNVATEIERMDASEGLGAPVISSYGGVPLHEQSHGESFLALAMNRLGGNGLYLFDEPEAALSPQNQLALLARMHQLVQKNSQFIVATHSPILMAYPGAQILVLDEDGVEETPYEQVGHVRLMKRFVNDPQGVLRHLLEEDV